MNLDETRLTKLSRRLSYLLRHDPATPRHPGGWLSLEFLAAKGIAPDEVKAIVDHDSKQRYELSDDALMVRALYGHSVPVDLALEAKTPPTVLYHGTSSAAVASIKVHGIMPRARNFVHLSPDPATASAVGSRHGQPVTLAIDAAAMAADGHIFLNPAPGTWLTDSVAPQYIHEI